MYPERETDVLYVSELLDGEQIIAVRKDGRLNIYRDNGKLVDLDEPNYWARAFMEVFQDYEEQVLGSLMENEAWVFRWMAFQREHAYELPCAPIVLTDALDQFGMPYSIVGFAIRAESTGLPTLKPFHKGGPLGIRQAKQMLGDGQFGAVGGAYGALWRMERPRTEFLMRPQIITRAEAVFKCLASPSQ